MCGNALRCAAWCAAVDHGHAQPALVMAGVRHQALVQAGEIAVTAHAGPVQLAAITVGDRGQVFTFDTVHTGTEHAVAFVTDVDALDVTRLGRAVRQHPGFGHGGTNVSFVQAAGPNELRIRTYERGVEAETLSCGSGAVAAVVTARERQLLADGTVVVHNRAREPLKVWPDQAATDGTFWIGGPVSVIFTGAI
jgi:diaminopimelate epimerase